MNSISGIITTLNEEQNICDAIASLRQVCNEVVVVDSLSSDRTVELARQCGAIVVSQPYLGDGIQKNVALDYVKNRWVLSLDADERLTDDLVAFINSTDLDAAAYDGYAFRRRNYIGSRWVRCCGWYPDYLVRLFRHDKLRFRDTRQHSGIQENNTLRVKYDLLHYSYSCMGDLFAKPGRNFSTRSAKVIYLSGRKVHAWTPLLHFCGAFMSNYFLKGGILAGIDGFSLTLSKALNSYLKYAKVLEWQRDEKVRNSTDFDKIW